MEIPGHLLSMVPAGSVIIRQDAHPLAGKPAIVAGSPFSRALGTSGRCQAKSGQGVTIFFALTDEDGLGLDDLGQAVGHKLDTLDGIYPLSVSVRPALRKRLRFPSRDLEDQLAVRIEVIVSGDNPAATATGGLVAAVVAFNAKVTGQLAGRLSLG